MDYAAARKAMIDSQIRPNDVTDHEILAAFGAIEREPFLPMERRPHAYVEMEIAYADHRSMVPARDFSKLLQAMDIRSGDLILDVANGNGYSTAILASLGEMVVGIENSEPLAVAAEEQLGSMGISNAAVITGDLTSGAVSQGPFNAILICAVIEKTPETLIDQLTMGGRLGAFLFENGVTKGVTYLKSPSGVSKVDHFTACVTNSLPEFKKSKEFIF